MVIKLGGSMMRSPQLLPWLEVARGSGAILVPGGGAFADTVRSAQKELSLTDGAAHDMAILAMLQFGMACCDLVPGLELFQELSQAKKLIADGQTPVWNPRRLAGRWRDLPHDWSVSSDTLALRLAVEAGATKLVLVKAGAVDGANGDVALLDEAFAKQSAVYGNGIEAICCGPDEHGDLAAIADRLN